MQFNVSDDLNSRVSLCQGDITKINVDAIVKAANETLLGGEGINRAIHEATGPGLLDECQKSIAFSCIQTGIPGFDPKRAAEMALSTARLWVESNRSSVDCIIFCAYENSGL